MPRTKGTRGPGRPRTHRVTVVEPAPDGLPRKLLLWGIVALIVLGIVVRMRQLLTDDENETTVPLHGSSVANLRGEVEENFNKIVDQFNTNVRETKKTFGQINGEFVDVYHRLDQLESRRDSDGAPT